MPVCFLRCFVWLVPFAFIALFAGSCPARAGDDARPAPSPPSAAAPVSQAQFIVQAVQLMDQKKYADAVKVLSEALSLYPNDETLLSVRFDALRRAGRYAEALDDINAALKVTPYNASMIADRARICLELRQFDQAIADASKAISINSKIALFFFVRSEAYRMTGKLQEALADLDRVVSLVPNSDSVTLTVRGEVEMGLAQHDKALDDFNKAIALRETVENHFMRARAHEVQKNLEKAADDYRRATQLPATTAFEVQAQREARLKVQQLPKNAE